ncbi:hypothetical protein [Amycolatopsis kentuckyensis]|uniref:hypothetical protein n=1 Tax=Amycolatopsis kentuckyensis TaxID=218823 RepID=UPI000A38A1F2|nr:hypothetical protein [Amycolatopsis kentuckyensis]
MALALDASTPAMVKGTTTPATTASFSPPAGALLFALCEADELNTFSISNTGTALTWTSVGVSINQSGQGSIQVYWAYNASAQSNITVSSARAGSFTANALKVLVFTGAETSFTGAKATALAATVNITTTGPNSWVWAAHIEENGGADTAATGCSFNDAETTFGGIGGGVLKRTATTPAAGTVVTIGVTSATIPAILAFEVKEAAGAAVEGSSSTAWHPGRGPTQARFYKTPRATDAVAASPTSLTDPGATASTLGGTADSIAVGVALADAAAGLRFGSASDSLAIGVALADPAAGSARAGAAFGEVAVNSLVLTDPTVGASRGGGNADALATGLALVDGSAGSARAGGATESVATGIVLLDVISAARPASTVDTLAIGVALADPSVGSSRSGAVFGETATVALSLADPSVGAMRSGNATNTITTGLALSDTPGAIRLGTKADTLSYALVLADRPGFARLAGTVDSFSLGASTGFICQDFSGGTFIESYGGTLTVDAYAGSLTIDAYSGSTTIDSYGGTAANCGR